MSDQNPRVAKNLEDVLTEARRVLALVNDVGAAYTASPDVVMGTESWWLLGELAYDAKKGLDAAADALPGRIVVTRLDDLAGLTVVAKPASKPAA